VHLTAIAVRIIGISVHLIVTAVYLIGISVQATAVHIIEISVHLTDPCTLQLQLYILWGYQVLRNIRMSPVNPCVTGTPVLVVRLME